MTVRRTLWLLFVLFILYGGTIPFTLTGDTQAVLEKLSRVPLNPLVSPDSGRRLSIPDVVQNVLLFLPFGALGFLAARTPRAGSGADGRAQRPLLRIVFVTLLGLLLSVTVEGLQLLMSDRVSSLGDVLTNTTGALLGGVATWQLQGLFAAGLARLQREGLADVAELRPFAIASLVMMIAYWQPFDVTLETGTIVGKVRTLETDVWQFTGLRDEGIAVVLCAFFATTLASYLSVLGERRAGRKALLAGMTFVCMLEGVQIFIGSRVPGLWDAAVATLGVTIGVTIWSMATRVIWPGFWLGVLVVATCLAAAMQMLSPFELAPEYRAVGWMPFLGYYTRTTFETLSHVIELMLLYFPLGFWLGGSRPGGRGALTAAVLLTLAIAVPIEYLQGWVVGRYPDVSDVAVSLFGAWLGVRAGLTRT